MHSVSGKCSERMEGGEADGSNDGDKSGISDGDDSIGRDDSMRGDDSIGGWCSEGETSCPLDEMESMMSISSSVSEEPSSWPEGFQEQFGSSSERLFRRAS